MSHIRLSALRESGRRVSVVGLGVAAVVGLAASPAQAASWSSSLTGARLGYESRRWADNGGATNITFTDCTSDVHVVNVTLKKDLSLQPDPVYTTASFTNCFNGYNATSSGNWEDHGSGNYYFSVNDGSSASATVRTLTVNY
ncbi:hypothetical protein ACIRP0_36780 [Streptomyces sp. NPDC101733]|uniref:hypothetical protein n=1 Tax=unclassified Streptomyces TaxID=2593676 RepID=UPI00380DBD4C